MKGILVLIMAVAGINQVHAADKVKCTKGDAQLILVREPGDDAPDATFTIQLDEELSSDYLGEVGKDPEIPEYGARDQKSRKDRVSFGDGNYWIIVTMKKGFLDAAVGAESKGKLVVEYNDIAEDYVTHRLNCTVIE